MMFNRLSVVFTALILLSSVTAIKLPNPSVYQSTSTSLEINSYTECTTFSGRTRLQCGPKCFYTPSSLSFVPTNYATTVQTEDVVSYSTSYTTATAPTLTILTTTTLAPTSTITKQVSSITVFKTTILVGTKNQKAYTTQTDSSLVQYTSTYITTSTSLNIHLATTTLFRTFTEIQNVTSTVLTTKDDTSTIWYTAWDDSNQPTEVITETITQVETEVMTYTSPVTIYPYKKRAPVSPWKKRAYIPPYPLSVKCFVGLYTTTYWNFYQTRASTTFTPVQGVTTTAYSANPTETNVNWSTQSKTYQSYATTTQVISAKTTQYNTIGTTTSSTVLIVSDVTTASPTTVFVTITSVNTFSLTSTIISTTLTTVTTTNQVTDPIFQYVEEEYTTTTTLTAEAYVTTVQDTIPTLWSFSVYAHVGFMQWNMTIDPNSRCGNKNAGYKIDINSIIGNYDDFDTYANGNENGDPKPSWCLYHASKGGVSWKEASLDAGGIEMWVPKLGYYLKFGQYWWYGAYDTWSYTVKYIGQWPKQQRTWIEEYRGQFRGNLVAY